MAIKETPTSIKTYFKAFKEYISEEKEKAINERTELRKTINSERSDISNNLNSYKDFNIDLNKYEEFVNNAYIDGSLCKTAKGAFMNRNRDYKLVGELHNLYKYSTHLKQEKELTDNIELYSKGEGLSLKEYTELIRSYTTNIHKVLILKGAAYAFTGSIGSILINRCIFRNHKPNLDYNETNKKKAKFIAEGKRIYNQEEADWCKKNGIPYKVEDYRVWQNKEYCYEVPLLYCKLPNGYKFKLELADYRHQKLRGKTNDDLIKLCNNNTTSICELPVDLKTKITLCDKTDKLLYTKFIRNEDQKPLISSKTCRKD